MTRGRKILVILTTIIAFSAIGYFREFLFENINDTMYSLSYHPDEPTEKVDTRMRFLFNYSYQQLYFIKWGLTIFVALIHALIGYSFLNWMFSNKTFNRSYLLLYVTITFIAFASTIIGITFNDNTWTYKISRFLMGIAQSPIPLLIVIFGSFLITSENEKNHSNK